MGCDRSTNPVDLGLTGAHAVVTGGASGIGLATAQLLAGEGATVGILDRSAAALSDALASTAEKSGAIYALEADVTDPDGIGRAFSVASQRAPLDVLVVNAGVYSYSATEETSLEDWDLVHDVNLRGAFLCIRTGLSHMKPRRSGAIVCVSSLAGRSGGLRASSAYASSKAGLIGFCRSVAVEAAPFGIRANCVSPGVVDTPMTRSTFPPEERERIAARHPLGRWGRAAEVAAAVVFLASPAASWITGAQLDINGGVWPAP